MGIKAMRSNLRLRVLTALIALPLTLVLLFVLPTTWLAVLVLALLGIGLIEWGRLSEAGTLMSVLLWLIYLLLGPAVFNLPGLVDVDISSPLLIASLMCWCVAAVMVACFPASGRILPPVVRGILGAFLLGSAWLGFTLLKASGGEWLIVWLLLVVWVADSAAYFGGRAWGSIKLAPKVSPGKTIEGAVTGILSAAVVGTVAGTWAGASIPFFSNFEHGVVFWILASLGFSLLSILGDLFVSLVKRVANTKDSGGLFPGHGGVLDRLDSLLPTVPLLALLVQLTS
ncbi:MAG: phosphatidate cytidylyltransferase [Gammaproteobacteria bacterium]|nr:phosphatidate cytidylyltransferase [Gammaproteobacteria bacterium]